MNTFLVERQCDKNNSKPIQTHSAISVGQLLSIKFAGSHLRITGGWFVAALVFGNEQVEAGVLGCSGRLSKHAGAWRGWWTPLCHSQAIQRTWAHASLSTDQTRYSGPLGVGRPIRECLKALVLRYHQRDVVGSCTIGYRSHGVVKVTNIHHTHQHPHAYDKAGIEWHRVCRCLVSIL